MLRNKGLLQLSAFIGSAGMAFQLMAEEVKEVAPQSKETMFTLLMKGGPIMIPLAICSIVALTIAMERFVSFRMIYSASTLFLDKLKNTQKAGETDFTTLKDFCGKSKTIIARILESGISKWQSSGDWALTEKALEDIAIREVSKMKRSLRPLKNIAAISPLLGLLGTVMGMINAFQTVALSSATFGKADKLAAGIYEAMVTTATGLSIAIPTLLIFYFLTSKAEIYADEIEMTCDRFLDDYIHGNKTRGDGDK
ncbi:MAG: MotA/TolQ/ExbB proton channel family protein [Victivallales bacterium]|nr:MotA/TolQ/ExbB proton channel family protein [Victivallales bacterium]